MADGFQDEDQWEDDAETVHIDSTHDWNSDDVDESARMPPSGGGDGKSLAWHVDELCDDEHEAYVLWEADSGDPFYGVCCAGDGDDSCYVGGTILSMGLGEIRKIINGSETWLDTGFIGYTMPYYVLLRVEFTPSKQQTCYVKRNSGDSWTEAIQTTDTDIDAGNNRVGIYGELAPFGGSEWIKLGEFAAGGDGTL